MRRIFEAMFYASTLRFAAALAGLLVGLVVSPGCEKPPSRPSANAVNLALRRTADQLLRLEGDSTTNIPPVRQPDDSTFIVVLHRTFSYDSLPQLLESALARHHIRSAYDVAVIDCANEQNLLLGYSSADYRDGKYLPCGGRDRNPACYNLRLTLLRPAPASSWAAVGMLSAGACGLLLALSWLALSWTTRQQAAATPAPSMPAAGQAFGRSALDFDNLVLWVGGQPQRLTYREAKLLRFFAERPNRLLEREFILQAVWEDEGVVVGRSLDVFVSRLRKLLKPDTSLSIIAVHGIGYRLDITGFD